MNKLSKKFITGIVCILAISSLCLILFNALFVADFYLYQKKKAITKICDDFTELLQQNTYPQTAVEQIESSYKVIIAEIEEMPAIDNDKVNEQIQTVFRNKGISFQKYWLWESDYKKILEGENKIKLYKQENLNYSLLIDYMKYDTGIFAVTMIVPNVSDAFQITNAFLIAVTILTILITFVFIIMLTKKITEPLRLFEEFAEHMKDNEFVPIKVTTKDELQNVADSLNLMGNQIIQFQHSLQDKNTQIEMLLENVTHDLKTPISLIHLYANGMKDGIDDGTFLNTIIEENQQMSDMVNRLLYLFRIEKNQSDLAEIDLSDMISQLINKYNILAKERQIAIHSTLEDNLKIWGKEELLQSLFLNLITNAVKYSTGKDIIIKLYKQTNVIIFSITNDVGNTMLDISKIWTPYYVGEQSRNKKLSGTGLGLSIVQRICETQCYSINCSLEENKIMFKVEIPA